MPIARVDGVDLAYERTGAGPPVLFCNGSGATLDGSRPLLGLFGTGFDLLAFDQRGLGASGPSPAAYGMDRCAADALALMDVVGWETAMVLGVSFGGMVAQELAVTAPARVDRLVLLCTSAGGAGGASYPLHELDGLSADERAERMATLVDARFDAAWLEAHPSDRSLLSMLSSRQPEASHDVVAGRRAQMAARKDHDVWDRLGSITAPTFVGCGRYDPIAPMANSIAIASRIPHAELHAYEGGHAFFVQDRAALDDVRAFLHGASAPSSQTGH